MVDEERKRLTAFYAEFYGGKCELSRKQVRAKLSQFPFCLNKREATGFLNESIKEGVVVPSGFTKKLLFKHRE